MNKIVKSSRGRCLCQSLEAMQQCTGYIPIDYTPTEDDAYSEMCAWLYRGNGTICLYADEAELMAMKL